MFLRLPSHGKNRDFLNFQHFHFSVGFAAAGRACPQKFRCQKLQIAFNYSFPDSKSSLSISAFYLFGVFFSFNLNLGNIFPP